ncbi:MAG TPA: ATP-binding protein [Patescibacteria group bacterium]|nr:ATP-binding protein [Patescibacteria group bacterium]
MAFTPNQLQQNKQESDDLAQSSQSQGTVDQKQTKEMLEAEKFYSEGTVAIRDIIAPSGMEVNPDALRLGSSWCRTLFVIGYPRYISVGWFAPIINFNGPIDISMFFYPIPTEIVLKQMRNKVGNIQAQLVADAEKGAPRDPLRESALQDLEKLRDDITQGIEKFFQFALYVTMYAKTKEELDQQTVKIESIFGSKLVVTKRSLWQNEQGFNATLPLANDELNVSFNMNSSPIASSFPFISSDLTSDHGILYGINRHNNSLIIFDRFSLQNANSVVFATSGAGKSYAVKLEVLRSLMVGTDVIIIDPEREYKHLSDAVGGTYINISLSSDSKINPFDLPRAVGEGTSVADVIRSAVITVKGLLRIMLGKMNQTEDSLLDRALLEVYAKRDITPDADLSKVEIPVMQDLLDVLNGMDGGENLAERLKKYTDGTFSGLFNNRTNIDMDNQLVIFSVRDLEDELRPMAVYMIVNYIWNIVRSKLKKRILVVDEAWWLMQHEDSARFIFALVKRCRKYYLGVTTITQDVNDFLLSPYGQAIVTNSPMQVLLRQSTASIDIVSKTFMLTQGERYLLLESGVGEGIFFAGNKHAAIKIIASYTEDQIITSDPRQLLEIEEAKKEFENAQLEGFGATQEKEDDQVPATATPQPAQPASVA